MNLKILKRILMLVVFISTIGLFINISVSGITENNYISFKYANIYLENNRKLESCEIINDFNNKSFILAEFSPASYLIIDKDNDLLIEGSLNSNSPYYDCNDEYEKKYLGIGSYYLLLNNTFYDISKNKFIAYNLIYDILLDNSIEFESRLNNYSSENNIQTVVNSGYTYIDEYEYFQGLNAYSENENGDCGIVALCMLLGYFNTFYNSQTIPEDDEDDEEEYGDSGEIITSTYNYYPQVTDIDDLNNINLYDDFNTLPGTGDKLHRILKEYGHSILNINSSGITDSFPMGGIELRNTFNDYKNDYIPEQYREYYETNIYRNESLSNYLTYDIDNGRPELLILTSYAYDNGDGVYTGENFHIVVAYGHNDFVYVCNMGWSDNRTQSLVAVTLFESIFSINYTGPHVHNENIKWEYVTIDNICSGSFCPCGKMLNMEGHSFESNSGIYTCSYCGYICYDHEYSYYSYNLRCHKYKCDICGKIVQSNHTLVYRNLRYYCTDCPYVSLNGIGTYD